MPARAPALPLPPVPLTPRRRGRPPRVEAERTTITIRARAKGWAIAEAARRGVDLGTVVEECIEAMLGEGRAA
jgi:hypothetical protein